ncbi:MULTISPECIES: glutathione S-transferase N-terminal domain-containing protein [Motilimonas]|uniref:Glutathione S-transferase N-terminal domain-containing protein n=1 Tax=Motilimonas cestriensis TaxID=2742685 RepID=A0ABS8W9F5_9GAMM|nr:MULTISPECIES: glutathione S-transferase N-terminal domain-containing protein [Motilimonas]MCE0556442.1 glutathione S-transferase N-terminal domain-containing protein [Motilimonas sp. E26]MCE2594348.1 glutathione S-transferase N-terminal domain-containing protein [Motilimonas cestriensis]MDO6527071.1 glutathione S-transferase N-terminal domain-containing protein [Motilimonas sp. 1_MG-2023]
MTYSSKDVALYHFTACPYCRKVRDSLNEQKLNIELRDVRKHTHYHQELISKGGKATVPCLRIKEADGYRWLYESNDIIKFLKQQVK